MAILSASWPCVRKGGAQCTRCRGIQRARNSDGYFLSLSSLKVPIALASSLPAASRASDSQNAVD